MINEKLGTGEIISTSLKQVIYNCEECGIEINIEDENDPHADYSLKDESGIIRVWCKEHYQ